MASSNIQSMISSVYYNYYQALCILQSNDNSQIVYGYQPSLNQPNVKIMGNDGNNYYYKGTKIHFTNTVQQNIPNITPDNNTYMIIIEHQALTNSINGVYSTLYVVIFINNSIAQNNDFITLFNSNNNNSSVNINSILISPNDIDSDNSVFFLDSQTNSAVLVFSDYINMSTDNLNTINANGNGALLFNVQQNTPTCSVQLYKSLESWLQCQMVSSNDDQEVAIKSVPINDNTSASNQSTVFIIIIVIGILIVTYTMLPRVYFWLITDKPKNAREFKTKFVIDKNENTYILIIGLLISITFVILGLLSVTNNIQGLTDNMSSGFLLTGISLFLFVPFCIMIINNFRTNDYQIWLLNKMYETQNNT